ncbi:MULTISPECIES: GlxA family transcriptional regulator [Mycobacteroides]|jgi:transcriptional regulator GlxA family with amidase domain|uniref:GlxA family transcriptional regulator n=1 Tax=Mycobacteroides TaxID=670516 RepID=UPI0009930601|nr:MULTISPECIES: helix-turn-helix domain-containing protein [Mycobacteroides]MBF9326651.1 helix-turn-helix domain-containing protein [Mycobacteroides chelonae]MBF9420828.1 helix-turn-helix domain-containing protein [Mycobacteroides chelonae]MBF9436981.1 helix-turn-helix domain-containing protein [Mycobacteroides chelonae]MBV6360730.1 helix-turn-helix domain-containing protein [Mycobacteroides chelonae]MEC4833818.1 helix-turn-helix domain-containing protein [Mycobacteroides chelonae]
MHSVPGCSGEPHSVLLGHSGEPHSVLVLALPDTIGFDLATAVEVFRRVHLADGTRPYRVRVCGTAPVVSAGPFGIATDLGLEALSNADTIVVPARNDVTAPTPDGVIEALQAAHARGARIASICAGAFTLAEAGILDGKRATTHWLAADLFRQMYPDVRLDADVLYVDEGQVLTSAGASAGLDLCLHMVTCDHGTAVAAEAARVAVAPLHRDGGQAQYVIRNRQRTEAGLGEMLAWIEHNAHRELSLEDLAVQASTSVRSLNRRFRAETGQTPMQWLTGVRVRHAQQLLECSADSVEWIGREVGFGSPANFREQFRRLTGVSPLAYRNTFRARSA